jgi:hypothetical protein
MKNRSFKISILFQIFHISIISYICRLVNIPTYLIIFSVPFIAGFSGFHLFSKFNQNEPLRFSICLSIVCYIISFSILVLISSIPKLNPSDLSKANVEIRRALYDSVDEGTISISTADFLAKNPFFLIVGGVAGAIFSLIMLSTPSVFLGCWMCKKISNYSTQ